MPEIKLKTREEWPEGLRELAQEKDGGFVLNVAPNSKLVEFRDNNTALMSENSGLKAKVTAFESLGLSDPEKTKTELAELRQTAQRVKDGELKTTEAIDQEVNRRVTEVKSGFDNQIKVLTDKTTALTSERDDWRGKFDRSVIDREITNAVLAEDSGVNPAALSDILTRAHGVYRVNQEGKIVAMNGKEVVYGSDGVTPLPAKEWLGKVLTDAPYLAKLSSGSGATGGDSRKQAAGFETKEFQALPPAERMRRARQANK